MSALREKYAKMPIVFPEVDALQPRKAYLSAAPRPIIQHDDGGAAARTMKGDGGMGANSALHAINRLYQTDQMKKSFDVPVPTTRLLPQGVARSSAASAAPSTGNNNSSSSSSSTALVPFVPQPLQSAASAAAGQMQLVPQQKGAIVVQNNSNSANEAAMAKALLSTAQMTQLMKKDFEVLVGGYRRDVMKWMKEVDANEERQAIEISRLHRQVAALEQQVHQRPSQPPQQQQPQQQPQQQQPQHQQQQQPREKDDDEEEEDSPAAASRSEIKQNESDEEDDSPSPPPRPKEVPKRSHSKKKSSGKTAADATSPSEPTPILRKRTRSSAASEAEPTASTAAAAVVPTRPRRQLRVRFKEQHTDDDDGDDDKKKAKDDLFEEEYFNFPADELTVAFGGYVRQTIKEHKQAALNSIFADGKDDLADAASRPSKRLKYANRHISIAK